MRRDRKNGQFVGRVRGYHQQYGGPSVDIDRLRAQHRRGRRIAEAAQAGRTPGRIAQRASGWAIVRGVVKQVENLRPRSDINPDGPTTLTVIADTGSGSIMSTIFGQVTTKDRQCQFMPTIGSTVVP